MSNPKEIDELKKRLDELCDIEPSKVILDINAYEHRHSEKVLQDYGRFVSQFELYYDLIVEIIHAVNYIKKPNWPKHRMAQRLLVTHNLKSIYSSFDRLIKGFYEDSFILLRPAYEAFIKTIYITCHPDNPYAVVSGQKYKSGKKFNLTNFLKDELRLDWRDYRTFSAMTHANLYSVLSEAIKIDREGQKGEAITLKFKFDKKLMEMGINDISFLLMAYLKIIVCLFVTSCNHILKKETLEKAKELIALREKDFSLHPRDYWPQVIEDTKDIFKMIKEVEEEGRNWKDSWESVRGSK